MEVSLRKLIVMAGLCVFFIMQKPAQAQEFDAAFGVGTVTAPSASTASGNHSFESLRGGAYPSFSGDFLFKGRLGVQGEVAWRASRALYGGFQPYRPIFWDFNGIYVPKLGKFAAAELMAGIGVESLRAYQGFTSCSFTGCTDYSSTNHFMGHVGGGLRLYADGHFFVRPEAHLYLVRNNIEFSSNRLTRFGISLGYNFAPGF